MIFDLSAICPLQSILCVVVGRTFSLNFDCRISQIIFDFLSWRKTNMFENMFFAELFVSQFQKQNQNKQHHCIFLLS